MRFGATFVVTSTSPWPERVGLTAREVIPDGVEARRYPFAGLGKGEVVVFIADDPLRERAMGGDFGRTQAEIDSWTCVMYRSSLV